MEARFPVLSAAVGRRLIVRTVIAPGSIVFSDVIIVGFCAEYCVLSTYRGAEDHGLTPVIMRGGLASAKPENINFVENISNIISYPVLAKMLENC